MIAWCSSLEHGALTIAATERSGSKQRELACARLHGVAQWRRKKKPAPRRAAGKGGWLSRTTRQEKERFREELKKLDIGLEERMSHPVGLLSGGQRQALTLLMATMNPPKLLLLDEHTAALDPGTAEKVLNLTRRIVEENQLTCLMITHNMQSAIDLGNRILMMDSGNIVLDIGGEEKKDMTVDGLLEKFKTGVGKALDNDRILLSE